jgi:hypothetical protein
MNKLIKEQINKSHSKLFVISQFSLVVLLCDMSML